MANILHLSFNKDATHLTRGTNNGYDIYALNPILENIESVQKNGGIGIFKMLNRTNYGLIVGGGGTPCYDKNNVIICDHKDQKIKISIQMSSEVKEAIISKKIIAVCLQRTIFIYDFRGDKLGQLNTSENEKGLLVLNKDDENPILATLSSNNMPGEILIYDTQHKQSIIIPAHNNKISALELNYKGDMVASASECGTLIRVFNSKTGELMFELRRGTTVSEIYSMSFSKDSEMLACTSSNGAVHIFQLCNERDSSVNKNTLSNLNQFSSFLPQYFSSQWSFKQIKIDTTDKLICAFDDNDILHIASYDGRYFKAHCRMNDYKNLSEHKIY
jgi:WD40 repeat protein